jgi:hypothetical protein
MTIVFSSTKSENRRMEQFLPGGGGYQREGRSGEEQHRKVNMVQIMYTDVCKCKNDNC